ncbi:CLUMA_CG001478, isoform A [Clunio marinus]|uniref:CLUMA_CG001478, isoform A n=1 Tax=Clunio marinus TaxID=568069 RepID=A0A1J1HI22_9DIPT|nr:CLUMA_CG001478, isoform A [Clunio marinus]
MGTKSGLIYLFTAVLLLNSAYNHQHVRTQAQFSRKKENLSFSFLLSTIYTRKRVDDDDDDDDKLCYLE